MAQNESGKFNKLKTRDDVDYYGNAKFNKKTLEEFFAYELKGEKKNARDLDLLKKKQQDARVKAQKDAEYKAQQDILNKIGAFEDTLKKQEIKTEFDVRKAFLQDYQKQQDEEEKKVLINYFKLKSAETKKQRDKEKKQEEKDLKAYEKIAIERQKADEKAESGDKLGALVSTIKADAALNAQAMKESFRDVGKDLGKNLMALGQQLTNAVGNAISTYASYQLGINARLQGISSNTDQFAVLSKSLDAISYSPYLKAEDLYSNLSELVAEGIAQNVEQRAFLQTVKDGIATTFDANNSALKRIIRLQQSDSTAARLGMEAYLTSYLNELTKNTEYLQSTFDNVSESLLEASSLMRADEAAEFEYVVQKWLGTFTGLGLSESTAQAIGTAVGQLGSGNISALSGNQGMQNLLVMATAREGGDFSKMLTNGLTANDTNNLMKGIFEYLAEIGKETSNVVKSQYAEAFGVSVSDLVAARNIFEGEGATIRDLYDNLLTYGEMYGELSKQMGLLGERMNVSQYIENLFSNYQFETGASLSRNVVSNVTWKITDMIQGVTGGINIPAISVLGNMVDLNTTVENLIKLSMVGISTLGDIGNIVSNLSNLGNSASLLDKMKISAGNADYTRGSGAYGKERVSGLTTSFSTYVGNASGSDYYESSIVGAQDEAQTRVSQSSTEETPVDRIEDTTIQMKELLSDTRDEMRKLNDYIEGGISVRLLDNMDIGSSFTE